jgi:hypothetical protein
MEVTAFLAPVYDLVHGSFGRAASARVEPPKAPSTAKRSKHFIGGGGDLFVRVMN